MPLVAESVAVVVRTQGDPTAVMGPVRSAVEQIDPREVVYAVQTMDEVVANSFAARRFSMILLGVFAALALVLACVGIYGVTSYLVGRRTHEIGVRMALGAQCSDVLQMVLSEGAKMALVGVVAGVAIALGLTHLMSRVLYGVTAQDPLTFASIAILLSVVALAACYIPARRATRRAGQLASLPRLGAMLHRTALRSFENLPCTLSWDAMIQFQLEDSSLAAIGSSTHGPRRDPGEVMAGYPGLA